MKKICDKCMGNGYRRIWKDQTETKKITIQCANCNSSGEIEVNSNGKDDKYVHNRHNEN
tara:strand:+ start:205 stop:381 length:177 start_codon:yes stop_codon:yes gene_type:complete